MAQVSSVGESYKLYITIVSYFPQKSNYLRYFYEK